MRYGTICGSSTKKKRKAPKKYTKKWRRHSATESIQSQTNEEVNSDEATSFEERFRDFERQIVQNIDTAAAACKQVEEHPVSTLKVTTKQ